MEREREREREREGVWRWEDEGKIKASKVVQKLQALVMADVTYVS